MHTFTLNNGVTIPAIGFGTYKANLETIILALEEGYRYFDTASFYGNEGDIAEALRQTCIKREEIFIASKIWKSDVGYEKTISAFSRTLENLRTDYADVILIHWPRPNLDNEEWKALDLETWRAMEYLYYLGKIKALGLSNFLPYHAENIFSRCEVMPLPKSSSRERMRGNLECENFSLDDEDISRIENMPPIGWSDEHPDRERVKI